MDTSKLDAMVDEAIQDNMDNMYLRLECQVEKQEISNNMKMTCLSGVLKFTNVPQDLPPDPFLSAFQDMLEHLGNHLWDAIFNNDFEPPSDLEYFRQELWKVTQPSNNGVNVAPAGDVDSLDHLEILMPAAMDNYVVTVAGASFDQNQNRYIQWSNSQAGPYVDVAVAATGIVSTSGTGYREYNEDFNSTAASTGIAAGVTSLLKAENPNLTHDDIEQILERTAIDLEGTGYDNKTGQGFIDADAALSLVQNNDIHHLQATIPIYQ